jgi:hypothetical protein
MLEHPAHNDTSLKRLMDAILAVESEDLVALSASCARFSLALSGSAGFPLRVAPPVRRPLRPRSATSVGDASDSRAASIDASCADQSCSVCLESQGVLDSLNSFLQIGDVDGLHNVVQCMAYSAFDLGLCGVFKTYAISST